MDGLRRPLWLRLTATALMLAEALVAAYTSFWALILGSAGLAAAALGAAACAALAVWPVLGGRWERGALVVLQGVAVAVALAGYAVLALYSAELVRAGMAERVVHATPTDVLAFLAALALFGVVAAVIVVIALPVELKRRARAAVLVVLAVSGVLGAGTTVALAAGGDPCDGFRFDRAAWRSDDTRERVGEALVRCRTLQGMHRDEVDELLGGQFVNSRYRSYTLKVSEDVLGWPSYRTLTVTYGDDKRVRSVDVGQHHG